MHKGISWRRSPAWRERTPEITSASMPTHLRHTRQRWTSTPSRVTECSRLRLFETGRKRRAECYRQVVPPQPRVALDEPRGSRPLPPEACLAARALNLKWTTPPCLWWTIANAQLGQSSAGCRGGASLGSRSRLPFKVPSGGASSNALAWASLGAGVCPFAPSLRRVTPETGLWVRRWLHQRLSNSEGPEAYAGWWRRRLHL